MKTEQELREQIDDLNLEWNKLFVLSKFRPVSSGVFQRIMTEIHTLKWCLGYNYLSPKHTFRYDFQTGKYFSGDEEIIIQGVG